MIVFIIDIGFLGVRNVVGVLCFLININRRLLESIRVVGVILNFGFVFIWIDLK